MLIQTFFKSLTSTPTRRRPIRRPSPASGLCLETLEDRCLPSFLPAVSYPIGADPNAVVTAALRGAGQPLDLVVANFGSNTVSVLLGKGDGTFQPAQNLATGSGPTSLAVGDFNGDGKLDLVTTNSVDLSVLLGNGDGTFQAAQSVVLPAEVPPGSPGAPLTQRAESVAVGDLNGDGKLDLAVTGITSWEKVVPSNVYPYFTELTYSNAYVNVLLGHGTGTFTVADTHLLSGHEPASCIAALGDFNRDGKLDVVTGSDLLLGNGDGTLGAPTTFATNLGNLVVGDVNGDGNLDLVGVSEVVLGNGDGTFQAPVDIPLPAWSPPGYTGAPMTQYPQAVVMGDLNRDGKMDLAVRTISDLGGYYGPLYKSNVNVLLGHGDGTFTDAEIAPLNGDGFSRARSITAGNFNSDTFPDLAVADDENYTVSVLLNAKDWFSPPAQVSSFVVAGFPASTTAGVAGNFTVTAKNADGTTATAYTGTVHFSSSDSQAGLPADYTFTAADNGMHTFSATLKTVGTQSLTAKDVSWSTVTGTQSGITVTPAAASKFLVSAPAGSMAGSAFSVTVTARDQYNNTAPSYAGTIHFTSTDGAATLPGNYTFTAADAGVHAFAGIILKKAGSQTVTATDAVTSSINGGAPLAVNAAAASTMLVTGFPSPTTAGLAGNISVTLKDPYGNIASGYASMVHFTSSDGTASLPANYTFTAADAGVHTFSATLKTAGTQAITATDTTTASLYSTDGGISVKPAAASKFLISAPASVRSGVPFSLIVTVADAYGNLVAGYTGTIHFTSTDTTATLPKNYTFTAADKGVHTFTGLVLRKRGNQNITIVDTLNSSITGSGFENVL